MTAPRPRREDIDLMDGHWYARAPHDDWEWMRGHAPVYWDERNAVWGFTRYDHVLAIEKDPKTFSSRRSPRPYGPEIPTMIAMDDPLHTKRRRLVYRGFTPKRVRDKEPRIRELCTQIIDKVCEAGECDFVWDIAAPLPLLLIADMLGFPPESYDDLLRWSDAVIPVSNQEYTPERIEEAGNAIEEFREFELGVIADRRSKPPQDDLVSILCHSEIDGEGLDDASVVQESLLILVGGDETSRHVMSTGMLTLLDHPDEREFLARASSDERTVAVEELLRWVTPIQNMSRTVAHDVEIEGQSLCEGDQLVLLYPSANRDSAVFDDPYRFDLRRDPNPHLAFGFGTHFCLGASLARLEINVMFDELSMRLPDLELATDEPIPFRASNFIVGPEKMPVRFTPTARVNEP